MASRSRLSTANAVLMGAAVPIVVSTMVSRSRLSTANAVLLGAATAAAAIGVGLLIRNELRLRRAQRFEEELKETSDWIAVEFKRIYRMVVDPSGSTFINYAKLFRDSAEIDEQAHQTIASNLKRLNAARPFTPTAQIMPSLLQAISVQMAYDSNAIEGSTLTLRETRIIILDGLSSGKKKPMRYHLDALGHHKAFYSVLDQLRNKEPITLESILGLHVLVLLYDDYAGHLRKDDEAVMVVGAKTMFAHPGEVRGLVTMFVDWLNNSLDSGRDPLLVSVEAHMYFVRIHPFPDGNGRMSRLLMNLVLLKAGYPPVIVPVEEKKEYFAAIRLWDNKSDYKTISQFFYRKLIVSFGRYRAAGLMNFLE